VSLLRPQCRHTHIELHWQPPASDARITGDAGQLGHLFLNLLGNAIEAAGPGGCVGVAMERLGRLCRVTVSDTGSGPPPQVADRLFEPFVTSKQGGVGLGLAVARQVAEAHDGRISFRREAGRTYFSIELPVEADEKHPDY
jgi:signal transduction histidine kinase